MPQSARFNDGRTAARHDVICTIADGTLIICDNTGAKLDRWPLADIRYADPESKRRFKRTGGAARLSLLDGDDGAWLTDACNNLKAGERSAGRARWPLWTAAAVAAVVSLGGIFVFLLPSLASVVVGLVPTTLERSIGVESRDQILSTLRKLKGEAVVCRSAPAHEILSTRAEQIATVMGSPFPIDITVVRFPIANAFALPGGQVIILSELLEKAENGDEVIGVLAHEIAHAVRRDPLQVSIKQTGAALLVSLLIGDVFGGTALTGLASTIIEGGYSRDAEAASDFLAVTALNQLGLNARPLADFLGRMTSENKMDTMIPSFLSTHPSGADRRADIDRLSQSAGRALNRFEWATVKSMCRP